MYLSFKNLTKKLDSLATAKKMSQLMKPFPME